jgi:hypothetical protein
MICATRAVGGATKREHDHVHRAASGAEKRIVRGRIRSASASKSVAFFRAGTPRLGSYHTDTPLLLAPTYCDVPV